MGPVVYNLARVLGSFALLALFVFLGSSSQALIGFGGVLIALSLGSLLFPIEELLPVLVPLSLVVTATIVVRHGGHVELGLLLRRVLPWTGLGAVLGYALFERAGTPALQRGYGGVVAVLALLELSRQLAGRGTRGAAGGATSPRSSLPLAFAAGLVHGVYASGGPLLVHALARTGLGKAGFRATLCVLWLTMNTALTAAYLLHGRVDGVARGRIAWLLPVVAVAIVCGEWGHARVDERRFRILVCIVLLVAGVALVLRS